MRISDGSSDVCSSDLPLAHFGSASAQLPLRASAFRAAGSPRSRPSVCTPGLADGQGFSAALRCAETQAQGVKIMHHQLATRFGRNSHQISGRERSEEQTSEIQSLMRISYAVLCLKKKRIIHNNK